MTTIELDNVNLRIDGVDILKDVTLTIKRGAFVALIGPNGAGKSSLMKSALGAATPSSGRVRIDGLDASAMDPIARARRVSYLPQSRPTVWPLIVEDIVALGRYAYGAGTANAGAQSAVNDAINACGLSSLRRRRADTLSGGELARVHCARAFAAQAPLLLVDEPTNSLDPAGQIAVMRLIRNHVTAGAGALVILHDINLAAAFADRLVWLKDGAVAADGAPDETITERRIREVFGVGGEVHRRGDTPYVSYA